MDIGFVGCQNKEIIMKSKILLLLVAFIASNAFALEITNYSTSITGMFHNVIVAFEDMGKTAKVRCVIKKGGKPVGMKEEVIKGVGTIVVHIPGGVSDTSVSCKQI